MGLVQRSEAIVVGSILDGRYRILERVGKGGMGEVYKGEQISTGKSVAIKVISKDLAQNHENIKRFQREAKIQSALEHPNIVTLLDFAMTPTGQYYFAMPYIEGKSLYDLIKENGKFTLEGFLAFAGQILDGLEYAHRKGVVHRDIKGPNIVVAEMEHQRIVKILDFGLAKSMLSDLASESVTAITHTGRTLGTPAYLSPEQAKGEEDVGPTSDIYSVGVIFYQMLTGELPFQSDTPWGVMHMHISQKPKKINEVGGKAPRKIEKIIMRCLEKNPKHRYKSALSLKRALEIAAGEVAPADLSRESMELFFEKSAPPPVPHRTGIKVFILLFLMSVAGFLWTEYQKAETERINQEIQREAKIQVELIEKRKEEENIRLRAAIAERQKAAEEERLRMEAETKEKAEKEARLQAEVDTQVKTTEETQPKAEPDTQVKTTEETQPKAEPDTQVKTTEETPPTTLVRSKEDVAKEARINAETVANEKVREKEKAEEKRQIKAEAEEKKKPKKKPKKKVSKRAKKIYSKLKEANRNLAANRLTTPYDTSAFKAFWTVLALDSTNRKAKSGLLKIRGRYISFANKSMSKKDFKKAATHLSKAASVNPDSALPTSVEKKLIEKWAMQKSDSWLVRTLKGKLDKEKEEKKRKDEYELYRKGARTAGYLKITKIHLENNRHSRARKYAKKAGKISPNSADVATLLKIIEDQRPILENMVKVASGCFKMGDAFGDGAKDELPVHQVCLDSFYIDKYEVIQTDFLRVMGSNPSFYSGCPKCPVEAVTWVEANAYCEKTGKRLPTEAEWEFAARGRGRKIKFSTGKNILSPEDANIYTSMLSGHTQTVGSYAPNSIGLYDMTGNVTEWVADWYYDGYYVKSRKNNPKGPLKGKFRVLRGASCMDKRTVTDRVKNRPTLRVSRVNGFRCAR